MDLTMMERVGDRWEKMEGYCSTGQSPQWAVVPVEEEEEEVQKTFVRRKCVVVSNVLYYTGICLYKQRKLRKKLSLDGP
jgi:hypothetical protein